jgi:polyhydroxyalkanoate synthesis regulator phasin
VNKEFEDQLAGLGELTKDALAALDQQLVARAEVAAEANDAATLQEIADAVQAIRDEHAKRARAAEETRARVDHLMRSIRPEGSPAEEELVPDEPRPTSSAAASVDGTEKTEATDAFERAARRELEHEAKWGFRIHFGVYAAVQLLLFVIWAYTPHAHGGMPWFLYPLLGWGIGVVAHYIAMRAWIARGRPAHK